MNSPESTISKEDIEALAARCYRSPVEFARVFFSHWFPTKMPWVHRGILALIKQRTDFLFDFGVEQWAEGPAEWTVADLDKILTNFVEEVPQGPGKKPLLRPIFRLVEEDGEPKLLIDVKDAVGIIMPRGSSKTTLINMSNIQDIVYQDETFFLYMSESGPHAERQLGTIRYELDDNDGLPNNELLNLVFGLHKPGRQSPLKWTENYIETLKGVMVGAVGRGGQVRGFGKRGKRPGKLIFDDLEDEESVMSDTQRKKDSSWFFNAARPAKKKHGRELILGTMLHTDAILNKIMKHPEFTAVRFGAVDRQGDALWNWYMTLDEVEAKRQAAASVGELAGFYLEYMSEYKDDEARMFPENKLIYQHKGLDLFAAMSLVNDPAITEDRKGDMCAFAVVGIENSGHKHVLDFYGEVGMDPFEIIEKYFELHFSWLARLEPDRQKHGIEAIAFQRALIPMVRQAQVVKSKVYGQRAYFEVLPIFHGKIGKVVRIKGILKPLIWAGQLSFNHQWPDLHTQLTDFPSGELKDGPDVVAMAVAMLDPYVMLNLAEEVRDEDGNVVDFKLDLVSDQSIPLEKINSNWRSAP